MLKIAGPKSLYCDGISRRSWMQIGALGLGGLALPDILQAESERASSSGRAKGIINVLLPGGPSHLDMYDLKPEAPTEIRGEFRPIATNVPGVEICELMPRLAANADKLTLLRSLNGFHNDHNSHWNITGWESHKVMPASPEIPGYPTGDWPSLGAVMSRNLGSRVTGVPTSIDLAPVDPDSRFIMRTDPGVGGYLGPAHAGFKVQAVDRKNITLNGTSLNRLADRKTLLASFDQFRREVDKANSADGINEFNRQAFEVLTSPRLAEALDLSLEDEATKAKYGLDRQYPGEREGKTLLDQFLLARRVIEAGARCVTLAFSRWPFGRMLQGDYNWDWHKDNFNEARGALPLFDLGMSALIEDLSDRGLLDEVIVVAWGEFGRTPKINGNAGRDHWPNVAGGLIAGGGMKHGQVIGSTSRLGEEPLNRPVHFQEVFAAIYDRLGIDTATTQYIDLAGRPQFLLGDHKAMPELVG
ncbi:MAG: DUF1501 domain-containing protein [Planctomycetota bacterium]|nr:DUF1501 domain-containing protein [Planctomycetota bacterium]MDA1252142.1 DUF1501 domain-containing protein [Planctomycetota bacterium]